MTDERKFLNVGLVMPIAPIDGCGPEHWIDVKGIIAESLANIPEYRTDPKIVSEGDSVGLIHRRIVEGLYSSDIIICDVSCKNPNVMFELGMRLAFDKPTVIIKDDKTDYSFDTGVIEHLQYPRDLRYSEIVVFKERLAEKVKSTYEDSIKDPNHSPFLKSFGTFRVSSLKEDELSPNEYIIRTLRDIQVDLNELKSASFYNNAYKKSAPPLGLFNATMEVLNELLQQDKEIKDHTISELIPKIKFQLKNKGILARDFEVRAVMDQLLKEYRNELKIKDA